MDTHFANMRSLIQVEGSWQPLRAEGKTLFLGWGSWRGGEELSVVGSRRESRGL